MLKHNSGNASLRQCETNRLTAAMLGALLLPVLQCAIAADALGQNDQDDTEPAPETPAPETELGRVTVTGSLIPQTEIETSTPVMVISAEDILARGHISVADALQRSSMATGGVQGAQTSAAFTQGAETMSLFGLPPGYTKYLIDGRPMANYPALYNGSDTFNNISGIPVELVERIEILPGGQSSLYGSDAIAGVVNFILKKRMDGSVASLRKGWHTEGGGQSTRGSFATGLSMLDDRLNLLIGLQYEERKPIWAYDRDITSRFFTEGTSPAIASRNVLVVGADTGYHFLDPNHCLNLTGLFGATEGLQRRPDSGGEHYGDGRYCGSMHTPGYRTLMNGKEGREFYGHATFDLDESTSIYADVLLSKTNIDYFSGANFLGWSTDVGFGYFYDPNVPDDLLKLQRTFAPEEVGPNGYRDVMSRDKGDTHAITLGLEGVFGESAWDYDVAISSTSYKLESIDRVRLADKIDQFFVDRVLGPQLGLDPIHGQFPIFSPNYEAFYTPLTPEEFRSFMGDTVGKSKTSNNMFRAQITNASLFSMAGGDAGFAAVAEYGKERWEQNPDPLFLNGGVWGMASTTGAGERDRYALTTELQMPVLDSVTLNASARYDAYETHGRKIDKPTYSLGIEFRPMETLLLRGKYGTAFRSPTLSDLAQGESSFYTQAPDYYQCSLAGFDPTHVDDCPPAMSSRQISGTQSGNPDLEPIDADVWSAGVVWAPIEKMSIALDYHNWSIKDEVNQYSIDRLLLQEYRCRTGLDAIDSALCQDTLATITRNPEGNIDQVRTRKINVSRQELEVITATINYGFGLGDFGDMAIRSSFSQKIRHEYQQFEGDEMIDLLNDPTWSTDPKRKGDLALTWSKDRWSSTVYANWFDKTPNYQATRAGYGDPLAAKLGSFATYNASVTFNPTEALGVSLLVNNLTNKMPPKDVSYPGTSGEPYNASNFNPYGRAIYVEARYAFGH